MPVGSIVLTEFFAKSVSAARAKAVLIFKG